MLINFLYIYVSYGSVEKTVGISVMNAFDTQARKLGVMGVTIVAATGDDGANSRHINKFIYIQIDI
jgi:subtilase family serine protease